MWRTIRPDDPNKHFIIIDNANTLPYFNIWTILWEYFVLSMNLLCLFKSNCVSNKIYCMNLNVVKWNTIDTTLCLIFGQVLIWVKLNIIIACISFKLDDFLMLFCRPNGTVVWQMSYEHKCSKICYREKLRSSSYLYTKYVLHNLRWCFYLFYIHGHL